MKVGVLFSGGKDSAYALYKAMQKEDVQCLITVVSLNKESYMFHTPNIELTEMQAEAIGLPLISLISSGEKEKELNDLKKAIKKAKEEFKIEGIVSGAIASVYQAVRIQKICDELNLWCFNPLWQKEQIELLSEIVTNRFECIISGVFAYPLSEKWLGRKIDLQTINELKELMKKYQISPAGEGGELETFVLNAEFFKKKISIIKSAISFSKGSGIFKIKKAVLEEKKTDNMAKRKNVKNEQSSTKFDESCYENSNETVMQTHKNNWYLSVEQETGENTNNKNYNSKPTLVVDLCHIKNSLSKNEFVLPIANIIKNFGKDVLIRHYTEINREEIENAEQIILCGTALKDNEFSENLEKFYWLKNTDKKILGICAGMQIIGMVYGSKKILAKEIGMRKIEVCKENKLLTSNIEVYELHNYGNSPSEDFEILAKSEICIQAIKHKNNEIYGIMFHPEVRQKNVIENFLKLKNA